MEAPEEFSGSNDPTLIIKGKRTKRPHPSSPPAVALTSSLSSGTGGDGGFYSSLPSPASNSEEISMSTEEDEDMANCLILLAQGVGSRQVEEEAMEIGKIDCKFSSRRFTEMAKSTGGKAGFFIYECKTCNRTFPSFQALGGHRASHKKPKITNPSPAIQPEQAAAAAAEEEDKEGEAQLMIAKIGPFQMAAKANSSHIANKSKVHECSICGLEFSSGQALGGHMRRHRPPAIAKTSAGNDKPRNFLALDLNLPAPPEEDDHHRDSQFDQFAAAKQHLVFSAPALVDCHY